MQDMIPAISSDAMHLFLLQPDRIPIAMAAILLVSLAGVLTGPVFGNAMPFFWIVSGKLLGRLGTRLDRMQRKSGDLILRGFFLSVLGLVLFYLGGLWAGQLARRAPAHGATEIFLLSLTLSSGSLWFSLIGLYRALKRSAVAKNAYYTIAVSTRSDLSASDDFTITRLGMGLAARTFDKGVVAPVFWYLLCGLPGAYLYAGIAALAWRFGRDGFTHGFGTVPLLAEKLVGYIPGLIAGVMMALAGLLTPTGGMTRALAGLFRKKGRTPYAEGGLSLTAMAYALNVTLGGPSVDLDGRAIQRRWAGPEKATAKLEPGHLRRALYIAVMAHLLLLAGLGACLPGLPVQP